MFENLSFGAMPQAVAPVVEEASDPVVINQNKFFDFEKNTVQVKPLTPKEYRD